MKATTQCLAALAMLAALLAPSNSRAQDNLWTGGGGAGGPWTTPSSWNQLAIPNPNFFERAIVGDSAGSASPIGVANVTTDIRASNPSPSVVLGNGGGNNGTLNISSTGKFRVATGAASTGNFDVGLGGGTGRINVASGGVLEVEGSLNLPTAANVASTISLAGTASVTAGSAFLDRTLIVDGSNVNFSVAGNMILGLAGTHTWRIPATGASVLKVGGNADLGGTLKLEFPGGTPTVGSTWNLIDAVTVDANEPLPSSFSAVDASGVTGLAPGQRFRVQSVAGGTNGRLAQLTLEQQPVLTINRQTGAVSLSNPGAVATVGFDVYQIESTSGSLNPSNWNSMAPTGGWFEGNPTNTALSELHPVGASTIAASTSISLGTPFAPQPAPFGTENEDITFRFALPDNDFINGQIIYAGVARNTLTLNVNPATGEAQIVNGSDRAVKMDSYTITSASGSLKFGNGNPADTWNSLDDQATSGNNWFEANISANQIAELLTIDGLELAPHARVNIGSPFKDVGGTQDLVFQFSILSGVLPGDFNVNGMVDAADYTVWRDNLDAPDDAALNGNGDDTPGVGPSDYALWKSNFGSTEVIDDPFTAELLTGKMLYDPLVTFGAGSGSLASESAVPEPSALWLLIVSLPLAVVATRKRMSPHRVA